MNVSLTPTLEEFVQHKVSSGLYNSASEVIREGLRLLEEKEKFKEMKFAELRKELKKGIDSLDRGQGISGEQVFDELIEMHEKKYGKK